MAQPTFNGRIDITATSQLDVNLFEVTADFIDNQGVWFGTDIAVGDFLYVDLSGWSPGNVGKYQVSSIVSSSTFSFVVQVFFAESGDVITFDFLANSVGSVIRPTPNLKLAIAPLQAIQQIPENIAIQPQNEDLFDTIDNLGGGSSSVTPHTFTFPVASSTWTINHAGNSDNYICQVFDSLGKVVFPDEIATIDSNNVTITFTNPQVGKAQILIFN
jgi:hypothetical protein